MVRCSNQEWVELLFPYKTARGMGRGLPWACTFSIHLGEFCKVSLPPLSLSFLKEQMILQQNTFSFTELLQYY